MARCHTGIPPWILVYYVTSNHIVIFLEIPQLNFLGNYFGGFWLIRAQYRSIFIIVMWGRGGGQGRLVSHIMLTQPTIFISDELYRLTTPSACYIQRVFLSPQPFPPSSTRTPYLFYTAYENAMSIGAKQYFSFQYVFQTFL